MIEFGSEAHEKCTLPSNEAPNLNTLKEDKDNVIQVVPHDEIPLPVLAPRTSPRNQAIPTDGGLFTPPRVRFTLEPSPFRSMARRPPSAPHYRHTELGDALYRDLESPTCAADDGQKDDDQDLEFQQLHKLHAGLSFHTQLGTFFPIFVLTILIF